MEIFGKTMQEKAGAEEQVDVHVESVAGALFSPGSLEKLPEGLL